MNILLININNLVLYFLLFNNKIIIIKLVHFIVKFQKLLKIFEKYLQICEYDDYINPILLVT